MKIIKEYHIGVYQDINGYWTEENRQFNVFIPDVYHEYGVYIPYDNLEKNSKSEFYSLAEGIRYALNQQATDEILMLIPVIVMTGDNQFYIHNETDAIQCILSLS